MRGGLDNAWRSEVRSVIEEETKGTEVQFPQPLRSDNDKRKI